MKDDGDTNDTRGQRAARGGVCVGCGKKVANKQRGYVRCDECKRKEREKKEARQKKRANAGLCVECGKVPPVPPLRRCLKCSVKKNPWHGRKGLPEEHLKDTSYEDLEARDFVTIAVNHKTIMRKIR